MKQIKLSNSKNSKISKYRKKDFQKQIQNFKTTEFQDSKKTNLSRHKPNLLQNSYFYNISHNTGLTGIPRERETSKIRPTRSGATQEDEWRRKGEPAPRRSEEVYPSTQG